MEVAVTAWDPAREPPPQFMRPLVFREVGRLAEALAAYGTAERLLARVNSLVHRCG